MAVLKPPGDFQVPSREGVVVGNDEVAFRPADDEQVAADADDFRLLAAVVEDVQDRHRRAVGGPEDQGVVLRWVRARRTRGFIDGPPTPDLLAEFGHGFEDGGGPPRFLRV